VIDDGRCRLCPDHAGQLLARGPADAGQAAEGSQQRPAAARADTWHRIELGAEVAHRSRLAVECDGKPMRFVPDALHQEQRRIVLVEDDRLRPLAQEQQLFLLGNADRNQVAQANRLEPLVGRR
jgi:hypothetical protein